MIVERIRRLFAFFGATVFVSMCISLSGCWSASDEDTKTSTRLIWNLKEGDSFLVTYLNSMQHTTKFDAEPDEEAVSNYSLEAVWDVLSIDQEGNATIRQTILHFKREDDIPGVGRVQWDSRSDDEPQGKDALLANDFGPLVHSVGSFEITPEMAIGKSTLDAPGTAISSIDQFAEEIYSIVINDGMFVLLAGSSPLFDVDTPAIGSTWETSIALPGSNGQASQVIAYEIVDATTHRNLDCWEIEVGATVVEFDPEPAMYKLRRSGGSGTMYVEISTGCIVNFKLNQFTEYDGKGSAFKATRDEEITLQSLKK